MAGGWDADALAGRMEEALERAAAAAEERANKPTLSPEDQTKLAQQESLRLSIARIEDQLKRATNPAHRAMLERALQSLRDQTIDSAAPGE